MRTLSHVWSKGGGVDVKKPRVWSEGSKTPPFYVWSKGRGEGVEKPHRLVRGCGVYVKNPPLNHVWS